MARATSLWVEPGQLAMSVDRFEHMCLTLGIASKSLANIAFLQARTSRAPPPAERHRRSPDWRHPPAHPPRSPSQIARHAGVLLKRSLLWRALFFVFVRTLDISPLQKRHTHAWRAPHTSPPLASQAEPHPPHPPHAPPRRAAGCTTRCACARS